MIFLAVSDVWPGREKNTFGDSCENWKIEMRVFSRNFSTTTATILNYDIFSQKHALLDQPSGEWRHIITFQIHMIMMRDLLPSSKKKKQKQIYVVITAWLSKRSIQICLTSQIALSHNNTIFFEHELLCSCTSSAIINPQTQLVCMSHVLQFMPIQYILW